MASSRTVPKAVLRWIRANTAIKAAAHGSRVGRIIRGIVRVASERSQGNAIGLYGETPRPSSPPEGHPLVVRDLDKRYSSGIWASRSISFTAQPGEVLGILGPNGAGTTTLVRQITTELLPTSGHIHIFGHDVVAMPSAVKAMLGVVPQEATLFEYLSVHQHLRIFGKLRGLSLKEVDLRTNELVADLELTKYGDMPVDKLSGG